MWRTLAPVVIAVVTCAASGPACRAQRRVPHTVRVDFEVRLINAQASSWGVGLMGGPGETGFGAVNETIRRSHYASVGQPVFCKAFARHWDRTDPGHQLLCRIVVEDDEIYMCADQGGPDSTTKVDCGGPVYIPEKPKDKSR